MANEDQTEGKGKDLGGKLKEEAGDLLGDKEMKREGQADQVEGKVQKGFGDMKEDLKDK
ncbi:MAG: CsbD family protein [Pseudomonadota bacterium]